MKMFPSHGCPWGMFPLSKELFPSIGATGLQYYMYNRCAHREGERKIQDCQQVCIIVLAFYVVCPFWWCCLVLNLHAFILVSASTSHCVDV